MEKPRLLRITTVPISLHLLLRGQFRYMQENGFQVYTLSAEGKEIEEVVKEGVPHIIVPLTRKITPLQDLASVWKLVRVIRKVKPSIVHTHTPKAGLIGMLAAWICGVPVRMHTVAGLPVMEAQGIKRQILVLTEKLTYACAHRVYPNSEGLKRYMLDTLGVSSARVSIIGRGSSNGIDSSFFKPTDDLKREAAAIRAKHGITDQHIVFSFVGRIVRDKGIGELVRAFRAMLATHPRGADLRLLLIGPFEQDLDPLDPEDYTFITTHRQVTLAGFQRDVRPWLMASDMFVFPSYREGFPNVVMQASCLEIPAIVSDINGCNEIIQHDATGLVVPVKDAMALQAAMTRLTEHEALRKQFAQAARKHVVAHFDQQYVWKELRQEYSSRLLQVD